MESDGETISWSFDVNKWTSNLKKNKNLNKPLLWISLFLALATLVWIVNKLSLELVVMGVEKSLSIIISSGSIIMIIALIVGISLINYFKIKRDELTSYSLSVSGITVNENSYPWSNFAYFSWSKNTLDNFKALVPFHLQASISEVNKLMVNNFEIIGDNQKLDLMNDDPTINDKIYEYLLRYLQEKKTGFV